MLRVELRKTGIPWIFRSRFFSVFAKDTARSMKLASSIQFSFELFCTRQYIIDRDHVDVYFDRYINMSNGCGPTSLKNNFRLNRRDNTISFFDTDKQEWANWATNIPVWRIDSIKQAREAAYLWILCSKRIATFNRDVRRYIASLVLDTRYDNVWIPFVEDYEYKRKKIKR